MCLYTSDLDALATELFVSNVRIEHRVNVSSSGARYLVPRNKRFAFIKDKYYAAAHRRFKSSIQIIGVGMGNRTQSRNCLVHTRSMATKQQNLQFRRRMRAAFSFFFLSELYR